MMRKKKAKVLNSKRKVKPMRSNSKRRYSSNPKYSQLRSSSITIPQRDADSHSTL